MVPNPQHNPERPTRPREPDPHSQRTERGSEKGERVMCGVRTREDPTQPREPDPHSQWTERDSERGEGVTEVGWTGEVNWWSGLGLEID